MVRLIKQVHEDLLIKVLIDKNHLLPKINHKVCSLFLTQKILTLYKIPLRINAEQESFSLKNNKVT